MLVSAQVDRGFRNIDYDPRALRQPLRSAGNEVRKVARRLIARRAVSEAGQYPGRQTGRMQRSIRVRLSRSGYAVMVSPSKTSSMPVYYPAFVVYGHRGPNTETEAQARRHKKRPGEKVAAPRRNFIEDAAKQAAPDFKRSMADALANAIKPGLI